MDQRTHELLLPLGLPPATPVVHKQKSWGDSFNRKKQAKLNAMEKRAKFNAEGGRGIIRLDVELSER